jgi:2-C-methyl-D-erythritol 4-phosphate cytidylyltransferase/2-C-methyl-D-erythritol 2,4-cyclodiphosphate synthase
MVSPEGASDIRIAALVVAAGSGTRAGRGIPKQYAPVAGKPMLRRTLEALVGHRSIHAVQVVISEADRSSYYESVQGLGKLLPPAHGGPSRQRSVLNGLTALAAHGPSVVLIHDAARPFVSADLVDRVVEACQGGAGAVPVMPVTETVKRVQGGLISATVPREDLFLAQTPQGFPFLVISAAHRKAAESGAEDMTDDAAVAALAGIPVRSVAGDPANVKLTHPADFAAAEQRLAARSLETRTAQGFDVHAFGPGSSVWLCGIEVPHHQGLVGHSDADVGLHALTDALLGTLADGDIGQHFPPSDPQWRGASSDRFLQDAVERVRRAEGRIVILDVTLICEHPKIGPHRDRMREAIGRIAQIPVGRVSVKATTSERLGFTGRGEGIAALAVATIELPAQP